MDQIFSRLNAYGLHMFRQALLIRTNQKIAVDLIIKRRHKFAQVLWHLLFFGGDAEHMMRSDRPHPRGGGAIVEPKPSVHGNARLSNTGVVLARPGKCLYKHTRNHHEYRRSFHISHVSHLSVSLSMQARWSFCKLAF